MMSQAWAMEVSQFFAGQRGLLFSHDARPLEGHTQRQTGIKRSGLSPKQLLAPEQHLESLRPT